MAMVDVMVLDVDKGNLGVDDVMLTLGVANKAVLVKVKEAVGVKARVDLNKPFFTNLL